MLQNVWPHGSDTGSVLDWANSAHPSAPLVADDEQCARVGGYFRAPRGMAATCTSEQKSLRQTRHMSSSGVPGGCLSGAAAGEATTAAAWLSPFLGPKGERKLTGACCARLTGDSPFFSAPSCSCPAFCDCCDIAALKRFRCSVASARLEYTEARVRPGRKAGRLQLDPPFVSGISHR